MTSRGEVTVREMPPEMAPASESTSARRICDGSSSEPIGGGGGGGEKGRDGPRARRGRVVWPKRRFGSWDGGVVVDWWGAWPGSTALCVWSRSTSGEADCFDETWRRGCSFVCPRGTFSAF